MERLFESLPLGEVSVNFTINATAPIILAMYLVAAERQHVPYAQLSGTLQNDILKEFLSRKLFVYPPAPSMRMAADVVEFASENFRASTRSRSPATTPAKPAATPCRSSASPWPTPSPTPQSS